MHSSFERIINLPWKDRIDTDELIQVMTRELKTPRGSMTLFPIQAEALYEAARMGGLLGLIPVGQGKTLTAALLPTVLEAERPVIMTRSALTSQMQRDIGELKYHWEIKRGIRVVGYAKLSSQTNRDILNILKPDLIVLDESHRILKNDSARTRRLVRYLDENPDVEVCAMTGTMFSEEVEDMRGVCYYALGVDDAPLPLESEQAMKAINSVVNPNKKEAPSQMDWAWCAPFADLYEAGSSRKVLDDLDNVKESVWGTQIQGLEEELTTRIRRGFALRLRGTPGVVASQHHTLKASLWLDEIEYEMPTELQELYDYTESAWIDPDGNEIEYVIHLDKTLGQLSSGFYYRFVWPDDIPDTKWLNARNDWNRFVREELDQVPEEGYDSPGLIFNWWEEHEPSMELFADWAEEKQKTWLHPDGKRRRMPPRETVWVSTWRIDEALKWAEAQDEPVILWYKHRAMERAFRQRGIEVYGRDRLPPKSPEHKISAMSIKAHGEGRNLQAWRRCLIVDLPAKKAWEQLMGRLHRSGQAAEDVIYHVMLATEYDRSKLEVARALAKANQDASGTAKKLCHALEGTPDD